MIRYLLTLFVVLLLIVGGAAAYLWNAHLRVRGEMAPFEFTSSDGTILRGDLITPNSEGPYPAVVFLHGSGREPGFKDPTNKVQANAFLKKGIAVLVYDKRGVERSEGDFETALYRDFIEDALAGVAALRKQSNIDGDKIGLYAVSEGGWFTPEIAVRDGNIAFISNRVGSSLPWIDTVIWEVRNDLIADGMTDAAMVETYVTLRRKIWNYYLAAAEAGDPLAEQRDALQAEIDAIDASVREEFPITIAEYEADKYKDIASEVGYDPQPFLEVMQTPLFVAYGETDINIPTDEAAAYLRKLKTEQGKDIEVIVYPNVGHKMFEKSKIFSNLGYPDGYLEKHTAWARDKIDNR